MNLIRSFRKAEKFVVHHKTILINVYLNIKHFTRRLLLLYRLRYNWLFNRLFNWLILRLHWFLSGINGFLLYLWLHWDWLLNVDRWLSCLDWFFNTKQTSLGLVLLCLNGLFNHSIVQWLMDLSRLLL